MNSIQLDATPHTNANETKGYKKTKTAEMEYVRPTAGYVLLDYRRNEDT
jgi:hypothetical protein